MSVYVDTLEVIIRDSVSDSGATKEDWLRAINQAFAE